MTDSGSGRRRRERFGWFAAVTIALAFGACTPDGGGDGDDAAGVTTTAPTATTAPESSDTTSAAAPTTSASVTTPTTSAQPSPNAPDDAPFAAIDPIVSAHIAERGLNGAGLVVVDRDAGLVHEEYWGDFGPDRISLVASSSKMIVAGVLLALDDAGSLDLDAPIADVVEWGDGNPAVTPAQLVSNSSGLPGLQEGFAVPPYLCQWLPIGSLQACAETIFTTEADDARVIEPDTEFRYGGGQWQVAGAVAEIASGRSWSDLLADTYGACDVDSLGFANHWTQFGSLDFSYPDAFDADPSTLAPTANPNIEGGAYISPHDYGALLLMLLRDGRCGDEQVLSPGSIERMLADRVGDVYDGADGADPSRGYGMGWFVDRTSGRRLDPGAYGSVAWVAPDLGHAAYLVVEATSDDGNDLAAQLFDVVDAAVVANRQ